MSPLAGRRPDDQLSVRRARVPSGTRSALRRAFNPRSSQGSNGRCRICGTLLCAGNIHLSGGVQAGAIGRSWDVATRVKFPQEGALVAVRQRAASSSILQALPTRPSRRSEMVGLEQVTAGALAPVPRSPRSPENAMAHFVQQNETPRHPAESHGPNLASTSPGRLHR